MRIIPENTLSENTISFIMNNPQAYNLEFPPDGSIDVINYNLLFTIINNTTNVGFMILVPIYRSPYSTYICEIEVGIYPDFNNNGYAWDAINILLSDSFNILNIPNDQILFSATIKRTNNLLEKISTHLENIGFIRQSGENGDLCYQRVIERNDI